MQLTFTGQWLPEAPAYAGSGCSVTPEPWPLNEAPVRY
jgi:hypothetical protein